MVKNVVRTSLTHTANENGILNLSKVSGECGISKELEKELNTYKDYIDYHDCNNDQAVDTIKDISALKKFLSSDTVKPD